MDTVRRYSVREGINNKYKFSPSTNIDKFLEYYEYTLKKQGIKVESKKLNDMRNIIEYFISTNKDSLFELKDTEDNIIYYVFYICDELKGYYLFGSGGKKSKSWQTTIATWEIIKYLYPKNISIIDLEGVNSPKRGWFKQSFGGILTPYYKISI